MKIKKVRKSMSYSGNKYRLLDWIFENIPEDVTEFTDVFGGSGTVGLTFKKNYGGIVRYFDKDIDLVNIQRWLRDLTIEELKDTVYEISNSLGLEPEQVKHEYKARTDKWFEYKKNWYELRDKMVLGEYPDIKWFILCTRFSSTLEYNNNTMKYNVSVGDKNILSKLKQFDDTNFDTIQYCRFDRDFHVQSGFLYFDPPYTNSRQLYSESDTTGSIDNEIILFCDRLEPDVKFMISNYANNKVLVDWANERGHRIESKTHVKTVGGKRTENTEILIMNY